MPAPRRPYQHAGPGGPPQDAVSALASMELPPRQPSSAIAPGTQEVYPGAGGAQALNDREIGAQANPAMVLPAPTPEEPGILWARRDATAAALRQQIETARRQLMELERGL